MSYGQLVAINREKNQNNNESHEKYFSELVSKCL
jgi:hypothetical protein